LKQEEDTRSPGSLFYIAVRDLVDYAEHMGSATRPWKLPIKLDWPAVDVIHLSISDAMDVELVIRPELSAKSREHKIPIIHVSLEKQSIDTLNIESRVSDMAYSTLRHGELTKTCQPKQGFDSSNAVGFFTTFVPLDTKQDSDPTAVVVTREKRLLVQTFSGTDRTRDRQHDVKHYRIVKLLGGSEDRLLALGTTSANNRMLLLQIGLSRPEEGIRGDITISEIAHLPGLAYGDEFAARLTQETQGGKDIELVIIAVQVATSRHRNIYRVELSGDTEG
jgi:hypothetical protein